MKLYQNRTSIHSNRARKNSEIINDGDYVTFVIDPINNGNTAYFFTVNASNAIKDGVYSENGSFSSEWDGIFTPAFKLPKIIGVCKSKSRLIQLAFRTNLFRNGAYSFTNIIPKTNS